jgi:hypothetical protein
LHSAIVNVWFRSYHISFGLCFIVIFNNSNDDCDDNDDNNNRSDVDDFVGGDQDDAMYIYNRTCLTE